MKNICKILVLAKLFYLSIGIVGAASSSSSEKIQGGSFNLVPRVQLAEFDAQLGKLNIQPARLKIVNDGENIQVCIDGMVKAEHLVKVDNIDPVNKPCLYITEPEKEKLLTGKMAVGLVKLKSGYHNIFALKLNIDIRSPALSLSSTCRCLGDKAQDVVNYVPFKLDFCVKFQTLSGSLIKQIDFCSPTMYESDESIFKLNICHLPEDKMLIVTLNSYTNFVGKDMKIDDSGNRYNIFLNNNFEQQLQQAELDNGNKTANLTLTFCCVSNKVDL